MRTLHTALLACSISTLSAQLNCDSVNTVYAYTYLNHGAMFNVVATGTITLDHIAANLNWGTATYSLYYRNGPFQGHEGAAGDWTLLGTTSLTSNNTQTISYLPTVVPIDINQPMQAGDTIALYLTSSPVSKVFLTSTTIPWGTAYASDAYLSVSVARSVYQLFGVPFSTPQIWNGSVAYCTNSGTGVGEVATAPLATVTRTANALVVDLSGSQAAGVRVIDLAGRTVVSTQAAPGRTELPIDPLPSGLYVVSVEAPGTTPLVQRIFVP